MTISPQLWSTGFLTRHLWVRIALVPVLAAAAVGGIVMTYDGLPGLGAGPGALAVAGVVLLLGTAALGLLSVAAGGGRRGDLVAALTVFTVAMAAACLASVVVADRTLVFLQGLFDS